MVFIKVAQVPREQHPCQKPDSKKGTFFGKGTIWACDVCGAAFEYMGGKQQYDQRDNDSWWDEKWNRVPEYDQPDTRPLPEVAKVTHLNNLAEQRDGASNRSRGCFS